MAGLLRYPIAAVIKQDSHGKLGAREVGGYQLTKYPPAFDISLHVDDEGILPLGYEHVFRVVRIQLNDLDWTSKALEPLNKIEARGA